MNAALAPPLPFPARDDPSAPTSPQAGATGSEESRALDRAFSTLVLDPSGRVLRANPRFLAQCGYEPGDLSGLDIAMLSPPADGARDTAAREWRSVLEGDPSGIDRPRRHKDGSLHWIEAFYVVLRDTGERIAHVVEISRDITDRVMRSADDRGQIRAIHGSLAVVQFALDGTVLDANRIFLEAMGYRREEIVGRDHRLFMAPGEADMPPYAAFWAGLAAGIVHAGEYRRIGKDGREVWLQATYNPILDEAGRPAKIVKYATDITRDKLRQAELQGQVAAIDRSQGTMALSLDGIILDVNANLLAMLGYRLEELVGRDHRMLLEPHPDEAPEHAALWATLRAGRCAAGRYRRIGRDGREIWLQASYNPVFDLDGRPVRVMKFAIDITADVAKATAFEDVRRQAYHDPATSLPNRLGLTEFMSTRLAQPGSRLAVMYLDLDRFKAINDIHGHAVGDKVLGVVADRLRRSLEPGQIAARIGGDEFVVAAPRLTEEEATRWCQQVLEDLAAPIVHEGSDLGVSASIGIAMAPTDGTDPEALLRAADTALYRAKHTGRDTYCFFSVRMNARLQASRRLTDEMRHGIAAGEFFLEFQPRFDAHTKSIRGAEALVRWQHPRHGRMAPDLFIPPAERNGLILPLGDWVLQTACRTARDWPRIGVSVNVSPVQFRDDRLVERVRHALATSGLAPERLEIELTESVLLEDARRAGATMRELKALGVRLAVDDFGTGYASLSYLRSFPFDVIKIDRQFISDLEPIASGRAIVQAILALGKALGLTVTAEGVETDRQLEMLVEDHCAEVQGFLLARPMTAARLGEML